jgi:flagellar basal-body rod modification protein FlgD
MNTADIDSAFPGPLIFIGHRRHVTTVPPGAGRTRLRPLWDGLRKGVRGAASRKNTAVLLMGRLDVTRSPPGTRPGWRYDNRGQEDFSGAGKILPRGQRDGVTSRWRRKSLRSSKSVSVRWMEESRGRLFPWDTIRWHGNCSIASPQSPLGRTRGPEARELVLNRRMKRMSTVSGVASASDLQTDYMKLLVTQLQNQNPLEPMDNKDMSAQLAQFSQLQQTENLNTSFGKVLESVQRSYASSLIGKEVSFQVQGADGTIETRTGEVEEVLIGADGDLLLMVDDQQVKLADVTSIRD